MTEAQRRELNGLADALRSHAISDNDIDNVHAMMQWAADEIEKSVEADLAGDVTTWIDRRTEAAMEHYHGRYDNDVYGEATCGSGVDRCNQLLDSAMAICGHPRFAYQDRDWTVAELSFLELFIG